MPSTFCYLKGRARQTPKDTQTQSIHTTLNDRMDFSFEGSKSRKTCRVAALSLCSRSCAQSYISDSRKETLCNQYLSEFSQRFASLFPHRRELFILPKNEQGVAKFVCTTVRPTLIPSNELYSLDSLAAFVSRFIHYEPLEATNEFPTVLPSPTQVTYANINSASSYSSY